MCTFLNSVIYTLAALWGYLVNNYFKRFAVHVSVSTCFTNGAAARQRRQAETHNPSLKFSLHSLKLNSTLLVLREKNAKKL